MQFASLAGLWFGLTLPVIILMYLLKRKYVDTNVSSHLLWNRVLREMEANKPWQKLRNNALLLLQLAAAAMLVMALMQPFFWSRNVMKGHLVIVLDRSASMNAQAGGSEGLSLLDIAKKRIEQLLAERDNASEVTLITIGGQPVVEFSRESVFGKMEEVVRSIEPYYGTSAYTEAISLASALTRADKDASVRLFTDGQWPETGGGVSFQVPIGVEELKQSAEPNNVSIVQFGIKGDAGQSAASGVAVIKNWGDIPMPLEASVYAGNKLLQVSNELLQPGQQRTLYYDQLPESDYYKLQLDAADGLQEDNRSFAFAEGNRRKTAWLVTEGSLFLEKALQLSDMELVKVQLKGSEIGELPRTEADLIVLDGVNPSSLPAKWKNLISQKPVWMIHANGDNTADISLPESHFTVTDHPITAYLQFADIHIASAQRVDRTTLGEAVVSAGNVPLIWTGTQDGLRRVGFTFDLHRSDLPLRTEFPILVENTVDWLTSNQAGSLGKAIAGEAVEIAVSPRAVQAQWVAIEGGAAAEDADRTGGAVSAVQKTPLSPGLYQFMETDAKGEVVQARYLEALMDPRESNLALQSALDFTDLSFSQTAAEQPEGDVDKENQSAYSLVQWVVLLAMLVILTEWGVYQRGSSL